MLHSAFKQTRALLQGRSQLAYRKLFSTQIDTPKPEDEEENLEPSEDFDVEDLQEDPENDDVSVNLLQPTPLNPNQAPSYQSLIQSHFASSTFWKSQESSLITQDKLPIHNS